MKSVIGSSIYADVVFFLGFREIHNMSAFIDSEDRLFEFGIDAVALGKPGEESSSSSDVKNVAHIGCIIEIDIGNLVETYR